MVEEDRFRGEAAITLTSGRLAATFVPNLGMTGVSLRYRDREHLALPGGLAALRRGATLGLPLLAPWANRLASRHYRAAGVTVSLSGLRLTTDDHGLPIHGLLVGKPGWRLVQRDDTRGLCAPRRLDRRERASVPVSAPPRASDHGTGGATPGRHDGGSDRSAPSASGVRLAPVSPAALHSTGSVAAPSPHATSPRAGRARHPNGRIDARTCRDRGRGPANAGRPLYARTGSTPCADGRGRRRDRTALRDELPVRSGVGTAAAPLCRARADGGTDERARGGHRPTGASWRGIYDQVHAHRFGSRILTPGRDGPAAGARMSGSELVGYRPGLVCIRPPSTKIVAPVR